eukprot:7938826-Alexandrium_andersonii.AAC.1
MEACKRRLQRWAAMSKGISAFDQPLQKLPLYYVGGRAGQAAGSDDPAPRGWAALMVTQRYFGQVFVVQQCDEPKPGDVIRLPMQLAAVKSGVELAWLWAGFAEQQYGASVSYEQVGLASYR